MISSASTFFKLFVDNLFSKPQFYGKCSVQWLAHTKHFFVKKKENKFRVLKPFKSSYYYKYIEHLKILLSIHVMFLKIKSLKNVARGEEQ